MFLIALASHHNMATTISVRIATSLFTVAVICACAFSAFPVDGSSLSSASDDPSIAVADDYRGRDAAAYASRLRQLHLMPGIRHGGFAKLVPVIDRKLIVDDKRDDSSSAFDVDYGWGGGRFGKRRNSDSLGLAGRFGRSVSGGYEFDSSDDVKN